MAAKPGVRARLLNLLLVCAALLIVLAAGEPLLRMRYVEPVPATPRAVLEVRSHDVPFILDHGQIIGRLVYEHMRELPEALYGTGLGSNYQAQGLKLSKHFRAQE